MPTALIAAAIPYLTALIRVLATTGGRITLPDDLALIDLHVRRAMAFRQQLGVFDHDGWNHPGPAYFYLQSLVYRILGDRPSSLFAGAVLLSGLSALGVLWVVRRRTSATRTLVAAAILCWLGILLCAQGSNAMTYSEGSLGGLASPWNPMVVIVPLLLLMMLSASAVAGSGLSVLGAALVGSVIVQANISSAPLALLLIAVAAVGWVVGLVRHRGSGQRLTAAGRLLAAGGGVLLVLAWLPPVIEQLTGHPGNMTLIARYFSSSRPGQPLSAAWWSLIDVAASAVVGPSQVMASSATGRPTWSSACWPSWWRWARPPPAWSSGSASSGASLRASVSSRSWRPLASSCRSAGSSASSSGTSSCGLWSCRWPPSSRSDCSVCLSAGARTGRSWSCVP